MTQGPKQRQRGWWYPWIFVAFMSVVVAVNGVMIYFAMESWTGLETKNHYVEGLSYDKNIAAQHKQDAMGWQMALKADVLEVRANGERRVKLVVAFRDKTDHGIEGLTVKGFFIRPTSDGSDREVMLSDDAQGFYSASLDVPLHGLWDVRIHAKQGEELFQFVKRVTLP